jgi:hypothetical protein
LITGGSLQVSFWKSLFGWGKPRDDGAAPAAKEVEHKGFLIIARPFLENGHRLSRRDRARRRRR